MRNAECGDQSEVIARRSPLNGILDRILIGGARPANGAACSIIEITWELSSLISKGKGEKSR
jgi:hypothetical protein